ncbi:MAG: rhodanese-like domain-containing protein [Gemmatimonadota bacterium]|nr:rhodanese-like domain-containing protein [Gemmatimonadota bacterium]MDE2986373.1 rhodanese-like domain-containing protein [Gemmatimonadota bacterium]
MTAAGFRLGLLAALLLPAAAYAQDRDTEAGRRAIVERIAAEIRAEHPDVATITAAALKEKLPAGNFVLVDVRTDKERAVSTLPGAITAKHFEARLDELVAEGRTVVAYCTIGARSSYYARKMGKRGVRVLNLEGSVLAWTHAGGEFVSKAGPVRRVHVYGRGWNLAADGYEAVW